MILNLLVLLLILAVTGYFVTQGLLSTTLTLVTAIFSAILAIGLFEPLQGTLVGFRPQVARAGTFMGIYIVAFLICRIAMEVAVPRNIELPKLFDKVGGGVVGFFASMVLVGSCMIAIGMMPVHTNILTIGTDQEYSRDGRMQGAELGDVVPDDGMGTWPARFTLAICNRGSGPTMGGAMRFKDVHPDLVMESYGYRNVVVYGSNSVLLPSRLTADGAYITQDPQWLKKMNITDSTKVAAIVRIEVSKGSGSNETSSDTDNVFRITPTQVRLITNRGQHYPIGHLRSKGQATLQDYVFEATPLDVGHVVDDYAAGNVVEDWVFQLDHEEKPLSIEVKQLARVDLSDKKEATLPLLAAAKYPDQPWKKNHGSIVVTISDVPNPAGMKVYLVSGGITMKKATSWIRDANSVIESAKTKATEGTEPWASAVGKAGVPPKDVYENAHRWIVSSQPLEAVSMRDLLPAVLLGATKPDGGANHLSVPQFYNNEVLPKLLEPEKRVVTTVGSDGKATMPDVAPGTYFIVTDRNIENGPYYVWTQEVKVDAKQQATVNLTPLQAAFTLTPMK